MSRYIKSFENDAAIQSAVDNAELSKPYVAYDESAHTIDWNSKTSILEQPLSFDVISGGTIIWKCSSTRTNYNKEIEYKKNDDNWIPITATTGGTSIEVLEGDVVNFRGYNNNYYSSSDNDYCSFGGTSLVKISGNIMSLSNFSETITANGIFRNLFKDYTGLIYSDKLVLPVATLNRESVYSGMFYGCSSMLTAPSILPATGLTNYCYYNMFNYCTSLTQAPELPATTLAQNCYYNMFYNCSKLNYIKCLATDISAYNCTTSWVESVPQGGTFVKDASMTSWPTGRWATNGIPYNWTVQNA